MSMKKLISLILSLCMIATFVNVPVIAANATSNSGETTLFSDNFESYTSGVTFYVNTYGKYWENILSSSKFQMFAGLGGGSATATGYAGESVPANIAQIATADESGIGTGRSLKITSQFQAKKNQMTRYSGITESAVNDKILVFKTTFKVPKFVGFADGVGVYLATEGYGEPVSSNTKIHISSEATDKAGELMYLGARANTTDWTKFYANLGNGTTCNQLWTFGEKVADLQAGTTYTYTVTMTPNEETGKYDVETDLNGTKLALGQSAYASSSTVPTIEAMKGYTTVKMMHMVHEWYFNVAYCNNNIANMGSTTIGVTNAEGKYDNSRTVAYFDDMSLTAKKNEKVVFADDFEGYEAGALTGSTGWGRKLATNYDRDDFTWMCGSNTDYSADATLSSWIKSAATPADTAVIAQNTGVGTGKALKITGQPGIQNYSLAKQSNIDASIASKYMEFHANFKAPMSGVMGEGFGVWVLADGTQTDPEILYLSGNSVISTGTGTGSYLKGELMYVGSRTDLRTTQKTSLGSRATYLYVLGEKIARLNPDAAYDLKVILKPNEAGSYTGAVVLNGTTYSLAGTNMPTQAEFATFKRLYATPISRAWTMQNGGGEIWDTTVRPADMINENGYIMGRTIGVLDNLSLVAASEGNLPVADTAANMKAIDTSWTSTSTSFINAVATFEGTTATVELRSDKTSAYTPCIFVAAYDNNDALIYFVLNKSTVVPALGTETATITGLPEDCAYVKVFVWDTTENLDPVTECCIVPEIDN